MAKSKLTPELINKLEVLARRGLNDSELIDALQITKATFYKYVKTDINFLNALKKGREKSLENVENALFKIALGYDYEEEVIDKDGCKHSLKKYAKPELGAQIFILKNRIPKSWRDKIMTEEDNEAIKKVETILVSIKKVADEYE